MSPNGKMINLYSRQSGGGNDIHHSEDDEEEEHNERVKRNKAAAQIALKRPTVSSLNKSTKKVVEKVG